MDEVSLLEAGGQAVHKAFALSNCYHMAFFQVTVWNSLFDLTLKD